MREGWGTLKFICLLPQLEIEEHRPFGFAQDKLKPVLHELGDVEGERLELAWQRAGMKQDRRSQSEERGAG